MLLQRALSGLDAEFVSCPSAEAAQQEIRERDFAAAVIDVNMPRISGFDLAESIRTGERNAQVPIIFLTGHINDEDQLRQGYALGAVDFLEKSASEFLLRSKVSVFIDLEIRQRELMERELTQARIARDQEERREYLERLEANLTQFRSLSTAGSTTNVTRAIAGAGPIKSRAPGTFANVVQTYVRVLDEYLEQIVLDAPKPAAKMGRVITTLGAYGGGPRDLLDVHLAALEDAVIGVNPRRAEAYSVEGRLLALEMMGLLVDHYRIGINRLAKNGA